MLFRPNVFLVICLAFCAAPLCNADISSILMIKDAFEFFDWITEFFDQESFEDIVFAKFADMSRSLDNIEQKIDQSFLILSQSVSAISETSEFQTHMMRVNTMLNTIKSKLMTWQTVVSNHTLLNPKTIFRMTEETTTSIGHGIQTDLNNLQLIMAGELSHMASPNHNIAQVVLSYFQKRERVCALRKPVQQAMFEFYKEVQLVSIRGAAVVNLAWKLREIHENETYRNEVSFFNDKFRHQTLAVANVWEAAMRRAGRVVWRCDPDRYVEHETYDELAGFERIELFYEQIYRKNCRGRCEDYQKERRVSVTDYYGRNTHVGKTSDCTSVGMRLQVTRDYSDQLLCITNEDGKTYKSKRGFEKTRYTNTISLKSKRFHRLFFRCDRCLCKFQSDLASDNRFSMIPVEADHQNGRVVTGVRIKKHGGNFQIQIQEGLIMPHGLVNATTVQWKPLIKNIPYYNHVIGEEMRLVDAVAPAGRVVVGVTFASAGWRQMILRIGTVHYNSTTGTLSGPITWQSPTQPLYNGQTALRAFSVDDADDPTQIPVASMRTASDNMRVRFVASSLAKDLGQSTVPFIDTQEVTSSPPVPLSGVGLYHKGMQGYGGFVGAQIMSVNIFDVMDI